MNTLIQAQSMSFAWTPIQKPIKKWHIVKDDFVEVNTGRYKNQQGKVLKVHRKKNQVTVAGVNYKFISVEDEEMQRRKKVV